MIAAPRLLEAFVGDLVEEYRMRARRHPAEARAWLYGQLLRSAIPLALLALRRFDPRVTACSAAGSILGSMLGAVAQHALWVQVLVQVPLRAGHAQTPGWLFFGALVSTGCAVLGGLLGGVFARSIFRRGGEKR